MLLSLKIPEVLRTSAYPSAYLRKVLRMSLLRPVDRIHRRQVCATEIRPAKNKGHYNIEMKANTTVL